MKIKNYIKINTEVKMAMAEMMPTLRRACGHIYVLYLRKVYFMHYSRVVIILFFAM